MDIFIVIVLLSWSTGHLVESLENNTRFNLLIEVLEGVLWEIVRDISQSRTTYITCKLERVFCFFLFVIKIISIH